MTRTHLLKKRISILMASIAFLVLVMALPMVAWSQETTETLPQTKRISILICSPSTDVVYNRFGHAAIRLVDAEAGSDIIYNYGTFDNTIPNFEIRFMRGETDYYVEALPSAYYLNEFIQNGRGVTELVLNLSQEEISRAQTYLNRNIQPENRQYRYNFLYDNCATRLISIVKEATGGTLQIPDKGEERTWRELINGCCTDAPWVQLGIDMVIGSKADASATTEEQFFLPGRILDMLPHTTLLRPDGSASPLVMDTIELFSPLPFSTEPSEEGWPTPLAASIVLLALTIGIVVMDIRRRKICRLYDSIVMGIAGLSGCIIFAMVFFSVHPHTSPNYILFLLHPLHLLIGLPLTAIPRLRQAGFVYHFINFAELSLIGLVIWFLPQQVVMPLYVAGIAMWLLSARWILINKWRKNVR